MSGFALEPEEEEGVALFSKQPENNAKQETQDEAGHQWEMEAEIASSVVNIAGQSSKPVLSEAGP